MSWITLTDQNFVKTYYFYANFTAESGFERKNVLVGSIEVRAQGQAKLPVIEEIPDVYSVVPGEPSEMVIKAMNPNS